MTILGGGEDLGRKKNGGGDSGWLVILVLSIIGIIFKVIAENIGITLIVMAVVGTTIGIAIAIDRGSKKRKAEELERQKNLAIVNASETTPPLIIVPSAAFFLIRKRKRSIWLLESF